MVRDRLLLQMMDLNGFAFGLCCFIASFGFTLRKQQSKITADALKLQLKNPKILKKRSALIDIRLPSSSGGALQHLANDVVLAKVIDSKF